MLRFLSYRFPGWRSHARGHLVVAIVVASALVLIQQTQYLGWFDSIMLRMVSSGQAATPESSSIHLDSETPAVLLIGNGLYESAFSQTSPLDRGKLAELISKIAQQKPSVLAIDIDLSPGPQAPTASVGDADQQGRLDLLIKEIAGGKQTRIVLITPFPVETESLLQTKYLWMESLCRQGVQFAWSSANLSQGYVLRFDPAASTLGMVAAHPDKNVCKVVNRGIEHATFLRTDYEGDVYKGDFAVEEPFNAQYFMSENKVFHSMKSLPDVYSGIKGRPVFLGGGFGKDHFLTAFGDQYGVMIHAATYYTANHPVKNATKLATFLFEVFFGFLAGYLFHWSWCKYRIASAILQKSSEEAGPWISRYLLARTILVGNLILLGLTVYLIVWADTLFYAQNYWIDAGPVIIGVFIKTLIGSYVKPRLKDATGLLPARMSCEEQHAPLFVRRFDRMFWLPVVIWAMYDLVRSFS